MDYSAFEPAERFGQGRSDAARKMKRGKKGAKVIEGVGNIAALLATLKGGPVAGMKVKGVTKAIAGVAEKDPMKVAEGATSAIAAGKGGFKGLLGKLEGAKSMEEFQSILKGSGMDVNKMSEEQYNKLNELVGRFK